MYVSISVILVLLLVMGVLVDYFTTIQERNLVNKNRKISRCQVILAKCRFVLNGRSTLPLTVLTSVICLERTLAALKALIAIEVTPSRKESIIDIEKKLKNFKLLAPTSPWFYAKLELPTTIVELVRMLKHTMAVVSILKAEHTKGNFSVEQLRDESNQLDILISRLKANIFSLQVTLALQEKKYSKAQELGNNALKLLQEISCGDELVIALLAEEIEKVEIINIGVSAVIEEKNHAFYDKFKGNSSEDKTLDDGLTRMFDDKYS